MKSSLRFNVCLILLVISLFACASLKPVRTYEPSVIFTKAKALALSGKLSGDKDGSVGIMKEHFIGNLKLTEAIIYNPKKGLIACSTIMNGQKLMVFFMEHQGKYVMAWLDEFNNLSKGDFISVTEADKIMEKTLNIIELLKE